MRLHDFVPISDDVVDGESLIDTVFGPAFYVVDESGTLLTTVYNRDLLYRAVALRAGLALLKEADRGFALAQLARRAEVLTQEQYDRAVRLEVAAASPFDDCCSDERLG